MTLRLLPLLSICAAMTACPSAPRSEAQRPESPTPLVDAGSSRDAALPDAPDALATPAEDAAVDETGPIVSATLADSVNLFARDLHRELGKEKGNLFYSPLSVSLALTMTWAGARGETANEMAKVLHYDATDTKVHREYATLIRRLGSEPAGGAPEVRIANRLWAEKTAEIVPEFLALTRDQYGAPIDEVDFIHDSAGARQVINRWVKEKTRDRIPEILPADGVDATTRMVLANAIYLKASWMKPFPKAATTDDPFYVDGVKSRRVSTMHMELGASYAALPDAQALELPYAKGKGAQLSMLIVLPTKRNGLAAIEKQYGETGIGSFVEKLQYSPRTIVSLPRFKSKLRFELKPVLETLGMQRVFKDADFSKMFAIRNPARYFYISHVFHQALVETTETGTEAAAATAVTVSEGSGFIAPEVVFRADHPFLFLIRDSRSGVVLFAGRVTNPEG